MSLAAWIRPLVERTPLGGPIRNWSRPSRTATASMKPRFRRIVSIELSRDLYGRAVRRFRRDRKVELVHGDSGVALGPIVARLEEPALFWLDGHYSAGETAKGERETPIFEELARIFDAHDWGHVPRSSTRGDRGFGFRSRTTGSRSRRREGGPRRPIGGGAGAAYPPRQERTPPNGNRTALIQKCHKE